MPKRLDIVGDSISDTQEAEGGRRGSEHHFCAEARAVAASFVTEERHRVPHTTRKGAERLQLDFYEGVRGPHRLQTT